MESSIELTLCIRMNGFGPKQVSQRIGMSERSQLSAADIRAASDISNTYLSRNARRLALGGFCVVYNLSRFEITVSERAQAWLYVILNW